MMSYYYGNSDYVPPLPTYDELEGPGETYEVAADLNRYEAGCERERTQLARLQNAIAAAAVTGLEPPHGTVPIVMTDPRWPAQAGWEKRYYFMRITLVDPVNMSITAAGKIEIHYVWNRITKQADDFKFKNSVAEGCAMSPA